MAHYLALTCEALARSIYAAAAQTEHTITVQLYRQGLHNRPKNLRTVLQEQIDAAADQPVDAILLAYGMCGTATVNLTARHTPLVIPRAHDCITLYLGSRQRYEDEFDRHPGTYWYSVDYMERAEPGVSVALGATGIEATEAEYEMYVQKYGQENADMLVEEMRRWTQHYTRAAFIDTNLGNSHPFVTKAKDKADKEGWVFERMQGNRRLLDMLINGEWPDDEFLIVPPGHTIRQQYDAGLVQAVMENG
ncbi:MAG: DUF1638 domain-containing protein [Caldilineaceae bacterium]|nr:DUF1638 domain-containing protein [Caldilineaceae bacterium]MBP8123049.1 DUF1638 domain-containing protein [Caldilineaceae bacterium]MBP9073412.1 DUF1638 domain-containing protein [Caldilineaceae bacterium]